MQHKGAQEMKFRENLFSKMSLFFCGVVFKKYAKFPNIYLSWSFLNSTTPQFSLEFLTIEETDFFATHSRKKAKI